MVKRLDFERSTFSSPRIFYPDTWVHVARVNHLWFNSRQLRGVPLITYGDGGCQEICRSDSKIGMDPVVYHTVSVSIRRNTRKGFQWGGPVDASATIDRTRPDSGGSTRWEAAKFS